MWFPRIQYYRIELCILSTQVHFSEYWLISESEATTMFDWL